MAYNEAGAAVGAAGHYAAAMTSAIITQGGIDPTPEAALETFASLLSSTFELCEALKGEQPAPARSGGGNARRGNYSRGGNNRGGGNTDPGTVDFRGGKYAGKTIADVYAEDPDYLDWCVSSLNNPFMVDRIEEYLANVA